VEASYIIAIVTYTKPCNKMKNTELQFSVHTNTTPQQAPRRQNIRLYDFLISVLWINGFTSGFMDLHVD
jgi:hypothetical protein